MREYDAALVSPVPPLWKCCITLFQCLRRDKFKIGDTVLDLVCLLDGKALRGVFIKLTELRYLLYTV